MKKLLLILAFVLFSFGASANKKENYFIKNCLHHLWKVKDQSKNKIIKETLEHFGLVDLIEVRKPENQIKGFGPHYCYTDDLKFRLSKLECASSYGMCLIFDVKKPWGELEKHYIKCYMDRDGEVLTGIPLRVKIKPSVSCGFN